VPRRMTLHHLADLRLESASGQLSREAGRPRIERALSDGSGGGIHQNMN
jgi:hypothetical protein